MIDGVDIRRNEKSWFLRHLGAPPLGLDSRLRQGINLTNGFRRLYGIRTDAYFCLCAIRRNERTWRYGSRPNPLSELCRGRGMGWLTEQERRHLGRPCRKSYGAWDTCHERNGKRKKTTAKRLLASRSIFPLGLGAAVWCSVGFVALDMSLNPPLCVGFLTRLGDIVAGRGSGLRWALSGAFSDFIRWLMIKLIATCGVRVAIWWRLASG